MKFTGRGVNRAWRSYGDSLGTDTVASAVPPIPAHSIAQSSQQGQSIVDRPAS